MDPNSAAIIWGIDHEDHALDTYQRWILRYMYGSFFLSTKFPFLGASLDGIMYIGDYKIGLVEVNCPCKYHHCSKAEACKDKILSYH